MAQRKTKASRRLSEIVRKNLDKIKEEFKEANFDDLIDAIIKQISKGISPVRGIGGFQKYSIAYKEQIRDPFTIPHRLKKDKISPVNLKLTGRMHDSLSHEPSKDGVRLEFRDKKAFWHNNTGAGKSRVIRRILPTESGERFNDLLTQRLTGIFRRVVKKVTSRK